MLLCSVNRLSSVLRVSTARKRANSQIIVRKVSSKLGHVEPFLCFSLVCAVKRNTNSKSDHWIACLCWKKTHVIISVWFFKVGEQLFGAHTHFSEYIYWPNSEREKKRRRREVDMKRERKKERDVSASTPSSDWWWRWRRNVSFFLSLSLSSCLPLFSAFFSRTHYWVNKYTLNQCVGLPSPLPFMVKCCMLPPPPPQAYIRSVQTRQLVPWRSPKCMQTLH